MYKQDFFNNLYDELGIALENIVYYKVREAAKKLFFSVFYSPPPRFSGQIFLRGFFFRASKKVFFLFEFIVYIIKD